MATDGCVVGPLAGSSQQTVNTNVCSVRMCLAWLLPAWFKLAVIPFHRCCAYVSNKLWQVTIFPSFIPQAYEKG